jgi:hypothetical protein
MIRRVISAERIFSMPLAAKAESAQAERPPRVVLLRMIAGCRSTGDGIRAYRLPSLGSETAVLDGS